MDSAVFADALNAIVQSFSHQLRQRQMQLRELKLVFLHAHREPTQTQIRFVDPVHERERLLGPLLARMERVSLPEPATGLFLKSGTLLPLVSDMPRLLFSSGTAGGMTRAVPEHALVECLRGRFGMRRVHGIDWVAEHRPERAWCHRAERPISPSGAGLACPAHGRPLWLLPKPRRQRGKWNCVQSDPERIDSGWWDGHDVRREYHVVIGESGQKLWLYRDCASGEWYLHGIFG